MLRVAGVMALALLGAMLVGGAAQAQQIKAKPGMSMIGKGACCARVNGVCISQCQKPGGCTGKADCNVIKSR